MPRPPAPGIATNPACAAAGPSAVAGSSAFRPRTSTSIESSWFATPLVRSRCSWGLRLHEFAQQDARAIQAHADHVCAQPEQCGDFRWGKVFEHEDHRLPIDERQTLHGRQQGAAFTTGHRDVLRRWVAVYQVRGKCLAWRQAGALRCMRDRAELRNTRHEGLDRGFGPPGWQSAPDCKPGVLGEIAGEIAVAFVARANARDHGLVLADQVLETRARTHGGVLMETTVSLDARFLPSNRKNQNGM